MEINFDTYDDDKEKPLYKENNHHCDYDPDDIRRFRETSPLFAVLFEKLSAKEKK